MTDTRPALAHGEPIIVVAPEGVDRVISEVMGRHRAELDEALQPFGVALDDLLQPTWMRVVRFGDVVPLDTGGKLLVPDEDDYAGPITSPPRAYDDAAPRCADGCGACAIDALPGVPRSTPAVEAALEDAAPAGGCCGSGEACSSAACTGFDNRVAEARDV